MRNLFRAVKAGVRGVISATGPGRFVAADRSVTCGHCGCDVFERHEAQLNSAGMTLLSLDWLNKSGIALVCTNCGLIRWFARAPDRVDDVS